MAQLELTQEQCQALQATLKLVLSDLSVEIADTDRKSFRDALKDKRETLKEVLEKVDLVQ